VLRSDELKQVPDQLETLIGDKKFLQAAMILVRSIKTINKPEIAEIGALADLRAYFVTQESVSRFEPSGTLADNYW
jgi:exocyst complex component 4